MLINRSKLAIIAGGGNLVESYISTCKRKSINFFLIGIDKFYNSKKYKAHHILKLNNIGMIFHIIKSNNITDIVFLGSINKPAIYKLRPDIITLYYLIVLFFFYFKGDDALLTKIYNMFIKKGYNIIDPRILLKKNIANNKLNNNLQFKKIINITQLKKYYYLAKEFGLKDLGQSIIVSKNSILLEEDRKGTDNLIYRYSKNLNKGKFDLLVKSSKPNQNLYIDIPTIGPDTIINLYKSNLKGLIVECNKTFIVDPKKTFYLIKKYNLLYYAI
jgi:DUF1009 family protein